MPSSSTWTPSPNKRTGSSSGSPYLLPMTTSYNFGNTELTPLLSDQQHAHVGAMITAHGSSSSSTSTRPGAVPFRHRVHLFLEAQTPGGRRYERFMIVIILANVLAFIVGTLFDTTYHDANWAQRGVLCGDVCDMLWFGNYEDNGLQFLQIGATSVLELVTIVVFTGEYGLRLWTADLESTRFQGWRGRLWFVPTFFSLVDLCSTVPFYVDAIVLRHTNLAASGFLRMFRLLRMMRVEGRYDTALTMLDDVIVRQWSILGTALFVGLTTWITISALYYLVERRNVDMIYCDQSVCPDVGDDTSACTIDMWGFANCTAAGCSPVESDGSNPCYNMYNSIPSASYYALLNLFGEFPLAEQHSPWGKFVGTITSVVAVAVFALPAGIVGNGMEAVIAERRRGETEVVSAPDTVDSATTLTPGHIGNRTTMRGYFYNLLHAQTVVGAATFDYFINLLVVLTAITFMVDTLPHMSATTHLVLDNVELLSVTIFTVEYALRVYSAKEDPKYSASGGRLEYALTFLPVVDLLSFLPYWIEVALTGKLISPVSDASSMGSNIVKSLRLLRILRFEKYTHAFTSFDDVISSNLDVLAVTAFTAVLFWVFFAAFLYFSERNNSDPEMAANYNTVPNAMWITLLNLSGESPLSQYSVAGKVVTGILGLFATGIFGIPIGILGAGFEEIVAKEQSDNTEELERSRATPAIDTQVGSRLEQTAYKFVNGLDSKPAQRFEVLIYVLICLTVAIGVLQTVSGHENAFSFLESAAVVIFTVEYCIRLVGVGADPLFAPGRTALMARLRFLFSFYSIIDLLAIVPFYVALALPNSIVNDFDEYLRMLRILRLIKLDKYVPSITLIDDVIRLKFDALRVAFYAALSLWIIFAALLFLCEHSDTTNDIDANVPLYGCFDDCTMSSRFQTFFDSMLYTGIHLTGDYPIISYSWPARLVNFFMVIAAVGVVSVPSGLIASGFVEIVQSKNRRLRGGAKTNAGRAGDDWYEEHYRSLRDVDPPISPFGPLVDRWQLNVNEFLNGREGDDGKTEWGAFAFAGRIFIFTVILANLLAVMLESIPSIDRAVGNSRGNFFDIFEYFSVMVFTIEYALRLFCASKNREALFSTWVYATTFFGIVDFMSTAPWFAEQILIGAGVLDPRGDDAKIFRIVRIFRILQLEDFVTAFSKLDNVFRASQDVLKATGLMATIIWVGAGALFYIFEENNPNWRTCDDIPLHSANMTGCYDFATTDACRAYYPGHCSQYAFANMPDALYFTVVFLNGEWAIVDFTWPGRIVCLSLCVFGIALYAIPVGTLFDSFGAVLGIAEDDDDDDEEDSEVAS